MRLFLSAYYTMRFIINLYQGYSHNLWRNLKTKILHIILLLVCFLLRIVVNAEIVSLSLSQALDIIESENLQVLIKRQVVEEALQRSFIERSKLLPSVNLESFQLRTQFVNVGRGFDFPSPPPVNRFDAKLVGGVPVFNYNKYSSYRLAKYQHEISKLNYNSVLEDILEATTNAYLTHLRNLKRIDVIDANIIRDHILLELAKNQFQAGVATRIDVTRAEVQIATDEKERLQQETLILESGLQLKRLLKLDLEADLTLKDIKLKSPDRGHTLIYDFDDILNMRPDFVQASLELTRDRYAKKAAQLERLPSIELFGEIGYVTEEIFDGNEDDAWVIGVFISLPIFEGLRLRSNKLQAIASVRNQELALENLKLEINSEYLLASQDARSRYKQIDIVRKKMVLSEEELDLARKRFAEGVSDNRDVTDAQAALAAANDELVEAVYFYNLSRLELARSRGGVRLLFSE